MQLGLVLLLVVGWRGASKARHCSWQGCAKHKKRKRPIANVCSAMSHSFSLSYVSQRQCRRGTGSITLAIEVQIVRTVAHDLPWLNSRLSHPWWLVDMVGVGGHLEVSCTPEYHRNRYCGEQYRPFADYCDRGVTRQPGSWYR